MLKSWIWSMFRELWPSISEGGKDIPFEWDWYAWGWEGSKEPVVSFDARLLTLNMEFSRFLSLLMLLKTHFTVVSENRFPGCVVCTLVYLGIEFELACILEAIVITFQYLSASSCKLGFHPQRSTPSVLKASAPFYPSIFIKLENALADFTRWGRS